MIRHFLRSLILYTALLGPFSTHAQGQPYIIHKRLITQEDGLPDRNVNCGIQDKFGFLWFGTRSGLCYYDGTQFTFLTKKSHGLRGTSILSLVADDSVGIIITYIEPGSSGIPDRIIDVVNIKTKDVKPLASYYPALPFSETDVDAVIYVKGKPLRFLMSGDRKSNWVYSSNSGFRKVPLRGRPLKMSIPGLENLSATAIAAIHSKLQEDVILEEDSTVITFRVNNNVLFCPGKGYLLPYRSIFNQTDLLFLLTFNGTLLPLDSAGKIVGEFQKYNGYLWSPNYHHDGLAISPYNDQETAIIEMPSRDILFYHPKTGPSKLFGEKENIKVRSFFKDRLGAWWLCSNVGLYKLTAGKSVFRNHFTRDNPRFSFNNSVRGIYADDDVQCSNLYDSPVIILKGDTIMPRTEQNFAVIRVKDALWLGQYSPIKFDLNSRRFSFKAPSNLSEIWSIFNINDNQFFIGCTQGLARYDIDKDIVSEISYGEYPRAKFVYKIFRNARGEIMAAAENGIYVLSEANFSVAEFFSSSAKTPARQLPLMGIQDLYEDKDGNYWIASSLEGLFRWNKNDHTFQQFGIENGFLSTTIYGIQEDNHNNLWLSTDYGLTRFNKVSQKAITYTVADGIADNEFNRSSSFKDKHGRMYFGGMNGVTSFDPDEFLEKNAEKVYDFPLKGFFFLNSKTGSLEDKTEQVESQGSIVLKENTKLFTVYFSLLDYEDRQHRYAYKLEGFDKDWNYVNDDHIQLGNLPYRDYTLKIKAQLANGDWYGREINIPIFVPAPFYKKWWFLSLTGLLSFILVIFIIKIRTRVLKNKNIKLEQIVSERTAELQVSLNEQKAMLQEIHHRVKNNLQFIEAIINMQINISKEEDNQMALMDINRRINAMTLVHEMLYNKDSFETISVKEYIHELVDKLRGMVNSDTAPVKFDIHVDDLYFDINNCLAIGMITTELISNSFKHAFQKTQYPLITIYLAMDTTTKTMAYTIRDNGPGLPEAGQVQGLGMRLIDIFARQMRGNYKLQNQDGLLFSFEFGLRND